MVQSVYRRVARPEMAAKYVIQRVNKAVILSLLQNHRACIEKGLNISIPSVTMA